MKLYNLTTTNITRLNPTLEVITPPIRLVVTTLDIMANVVDGLYQPNAVKHYLDVTLPDSRGQTLILPVIRNRAFMAALAKTLDDTNIAILNDDNQLEYIK